MAFNYVLTALVIIPNALISNQFPYESISSLYLVGLALGLILHYYLRISGQRRLKSMMLNVSCMILLLNLLRGFKYGVFGRIFFLGRYTWYLQWIPMLCIPLFLYAISLYVYSDEKKKVKKWIWAAAITTVLLVLILTNDFHQLVYRFNPGFEKWDTDYTQCPLFFVATVWQYVLYIIAVVILVVKCRIQGIRKYAFMILIPFVIGIFLIVVSMLGKMPSFGNGDIFLYPEIISTMSASVLECCIQLGLIPTNESFGALFKVSSIVAQVTDKEGKVIYKSNRAKTLTPEEFSAPDKTRIGEHTMLRILNIPGGYGFWENDVTEYDRINAELKETKDNLAEKTELIRLQNEMMEKRKKIEQRTLVYDTIADKTQAQTMIISRIAEEALQTDDMEKKEKCRKHIPLLSAYIKRYANLMLLSMNSETIGIGELGLSLAEVLRYLNLYGVPGEMMNSASGIVPRDAALVVFDIFDALIETHLDEMSGVFVNLSTQPHAHTIKLTVENMISDAPQTLIDKLSAVGVKAQFEFEDDIGYFTFLLPKGGEDA